MSYLTAAFLGFVQGVTEFLPVSSDGHLTLVQQFISLPTPPLVFDILLHAATLLAMIFYFRRRLLGFYLTHYRQVFIATLPAAVVGFFAYLYLQKQMDSGLIAALGFLFTSLILFASHYYSKTRSVRLTPLRSFIIGLFQSTAIAPGISRSGTTIASAKLLGFDSYRAFEISFLLGIPAIFGAFLVSLKDLTRLSSADLPASLLGFITALAVGLLSLRLLDLISRCHTLLPFAWYTLILGSLALGLFL